MSTRFSGKAILIGGGTGGLGRAVSSAFSGRRRPSGRNLSEAGRVRCLKDSCPRAWRGARRLPCDATDEAAVRKPGRRNSSKARTFGRIGEYGGRYAGGIKLLGTGSQSVRSHAIAEPALGYTFARAVVPPMLKQRHGAIVNVVSKAALDHAAGAAAYAASKAAALP